MTMIKACPARFAAHFRLRSCAAVFLGTGLLAGCLRSLDSEGDLQKFGAIVVKGTPSVSDASNATATAIFFQAYSATVPNSRNQTNVCQYSLVDTTTVVPTGQLQAGESLTMQVGTSGNSHAATMFFEPTAARYATSGFLTYAGGDSVTVNIPGQTPGFPASLIRVRLAEPLIVPDVTVPEIGEPMAVRWNASADTTTAVFISLKYANPSNSPYANEQVLCTLTDDGTEDIPGTALGPFLNSRPSSRSLTVTRWRTAFLNPDDKTLLHIVSTVDAQVTLK